MSPIQQLCLCVVFLVGVFTLSESIMCYQCATTDMSSGCVTDIEGLINVTAGNESSYQYAKNCTDSNPEWDRCMIETWETGGKRTVFNRDCTSRNGFIIVDEGHKFYNLPANNYTTCEWVSTVNHYICYTLCKEDFCNGPQPPKKSDCPERNRSTSSDDYYDYDVDDPCGGPNTVYLSKETIWFASLVAIFFSLLASF
ncbi:ly6/PLAUR domain-containing protein 1-like [Physella acuta]|uniref:ly6/PLAUR domain-containing protein 1-like n=1 Tax=Physella acuta TaxID=109671 RepID=UPI0027DEA23D|nr:ly6/PLAUR domain-containing protein 1-like [Physella acuta]XP_059170668.1 ly6/PLAUR domain-containing protein 1-like [Physella acuta]XP_059170676.1 ly6/PLAUR domain-containing protein 1-like [Physella acuta]XP_059170684.1 ly6/PLAUR domain-containing protein 1-like [Physella acuta]XP_059170692.1 ly6/PLAUR domain-containing protein 1-like [Physella acuta]